MTQKLIKLLKESPNQRIDLKVAVEKFDIKMRRIYDIINILDGIGLIKKEGKNQISWIGKLKGSIMTSEQDEKD
jgi:hypothetical protein